MWYQVICNYCNVSFAWCCILYCCACRMLYSRYHTDLIIGYILSKGSHPIPHFHFDSRYPSPEECRVQSAPLNLRNSPCYYSTYLIWANMIGEGTRLYEVRYMINTVVCYITYHSYQLLPLLHVCMLPSLHIQPLTDIHQVYSRPWLTMITNQ